MRALTLSAAGAATYYDTATPGSTAASVQDCNVYLPPAPALTPPASGMSLGVSSTVSLTGVAQYSYTLYSLPLASLCAPIALATFMAPLQCHRRCPP